MQVYTPDADVADQLALTWLPGSFFFSFIGTMQVEHFEGDEAARQRELARREKVFAERRKVQEKRNRTRAPTKKPTKAPTKAPTKKPTKKPTKAPTKAPTKSPTKTPQPGFQAKQIIMAKDKDPYKSTGSCPAGNSDVTALVSGVTKTNSGCNVTFRWAPSASKTLVYRKASEACDKVKQNDSWNLTVDKNSWGVCKIKGVQDRRVCRSPGKPCNTAKPQNIELCKYATASMKYGCAGDNTATTAPPRTTAPRTTAPRTTAPTTAPPRTTAPRTTTAPPRTTPPRTLAPQTSAPPAVIDWGNDNGWNDGNGLPDTDEDGWSWGNDNGLGDTSSTPNRTRPPGYDGGGGNGNGGGGNGNGWGHGNGYGGGRGNGYYGGRGHGWGQRRTEWSYPAYSSPLVVQPTGVVPVSFPTLSEVILPSTQYIVPVADPNAVQPSLYSPEIPGMSNVWDSPLLGDLPVAVQTQTPSPQPTDIWTSDPTLAPVTDIPTMEPMVEDEDTGEDEFDDEGEMDTPMSDPAPAQQPSCAPCCAHGSSLPSMWVLLLVALVVLLAFFGAYWYWTHGPGRDGGQFMFL